MKEKYLSDLFNLNSDLKISSIAFDSRIKNVNGIFFCIRGINSDGHDFVDSAIKNGAKVIVHSNEIEKKDGIVYIQVENTLTELNRVANIFYDYPSNNMNVYAVTGTNGKTTTSYIIENILSNFEKTAYLGTVGVKFNNELTQINHMTTPDAITLCKTLSSLKENGCKSVAIEISSHALEQRRVDTLDVDVAIFTNLTHEHLDYHKTMDSYMSAKRRLFGMLSNSKHAILNIDDNYYPDFRRACKCNIITYGKNPQADFYIHDVELDIFTTKFKITHNNTTYNIKTNLVSEINTYNLTAAIAALYSMGHDINKVLKFTENLDVNIGRFQTIDDEKLKIIVDFAHTPDGFVKIFEFAKSIIKDDKNIISIFGSAGQRDVTKRPILGKIADRYCDRIIICEDDYRDEDPIFISNQILEGINNKNKAEIIIDRYDAIKRAISSANDGDIILILSKGLDRYISRNGRDEYWMGDDLACKEILKELRKN